MIARRFGTPWALAAVLALGACATPPKDAAPAGTPREQWGGRMSVRVESDPVQSFSAGFELRGNAVNGQLSLYSPIGSTVAQLTWAPGEARLRSDGKDQAYESLNALTRQVVGAELPITSIFLWLSGQPASTDGWVADLQNHANGRLVARRLQPAPAVEMRLILDQTTP